MDKGEVREKGTLRDVLTHYKGRDPFESVSHETLQRLGHEPALSETGDKA